MQWRVVGIERRFALLQGLLGGTSFAAETLAEALVIATIGPGWMPIGLAGAAMLSLGLTTRIARRPAGPWRLPGLAGVAVVLGLAVWIGFFWVPTVAAMIFLLVSRPLRDALTVTVGNVIASRYDPQAAKRALPRMAAFSQCGAIVVGLILPVLLRIGGEPAAIIAWPLLAGGVVLVSRGLPMVLPESKPSQPVAGERVVNRFRRSPLLWSLAISAMLAVAIAAALGLTAAMLLSAAVPNAARLSSIYSLIGAVSGFGILAIQLVGLPFLLRRLGTARIALLPPLLAVGVAGWAIVGGMAAGIAAQASRLSLRPALQTPMEEILLGLLPVRERAAGRAWLRGGAVPLAGLISSLTLAALAALGAKPQMIAGLALFMAIGGVAAALILRRQHRQAALALARGGDVLAQRLALPTFGGVDASVKEEIARRLETSERDDDRLMLVALLADLDPNAATAAVVTLLLRSSPESIAALLSALAEHRCPATALLPETPRLLASPDATVRRATLAALATVPELPAVLIVPHLDDPDPEVALLAIERLIDRAIPEAPDARSRLLTLITSPSAVVRASAAPLVARVAPESLAPLLSDPVIAVRQAAISAAGACPVLPDALTDALLASVGDSASSVRAAAAATVGRLGTRATPALVAALDDPVTGVRSAAAKSLQEGVVGRSGGLAFNLLPAHGWGRAAGLAILTRVAPRHWRAALLGEEGTGLADLATLVRARDALGAPHGPVGALLRRDVDDAIRASLDRWQECLVITEGTGVARVIVNGLAAPDPVVSASAQEALEAVRSPAMARQAAVLLRQIHTDAPAGDSGRIIVLNGKLIEGLLGGGSDWRRMLLTAAAREEPGLATDLIARDTLNGKEETMLSLVERATLLRGVPPFADLPSEQLRLLADVAEEIEVPAGETLIAGGSQGNHLYVVVAGQVALEERRGAGNSVARVATLVPGSALGEDAVFDGSAHVLSATAVTDCQLLSLRREVLLTLIEEQPALARSLITWLSARLRETTGKLVERTRPRPRSVVDLLDKMGDSRR